MMEQSVTFAEMFDDRSHRNFRDVLWNPNHSRTVPLPSACVSTDTKAVVHKGMPVDICHS